MVDSKRGTRLPLLPLSDFVCFPRTTLRLLVHEPRYRQLVRDLLDRDEHERWVGLVLVKSEEGTPRRDIYPGGTATRVVEAEALPDGRANLLLEGDFRFTVRREVGDAPYREALVEEVAEPWLNQDDAGILAVRGEIVDVARMLLAEIQETFPLDAEDLEDLATDSDFEELVNQMAVHLDLPAQRKLELLAASLPERALLVLSILKARRRVLDLLRPYRPLAARPDLN